MKEIATEPKVLIGLLLVAAGWILPLFMVMRIIEPTIFLCFFAYISLLLGFVVFLFGLAYTVSFLRRRKNELRRSKKRTSLPIPAGVQISPNSL
jgi:membrane protein implicated in regulation of membrane protease activity